MQNWQVRASIETLQKRSVIINQIREFFKHRAVLEVETPILASSTILDPNIESFQVKTSSNNYYLQTSPEFHMKRLLSFGSGDIFQISKVFRSGERGTKHNPEFSMLEWYRIGYDYHQLMKEVHELITIFLNIDIQKTSYDELFKNHLQISPFSVTRDECLQVAAHHKINAYKEDELDIDQWLDLFLAEIIEPTMPKNIALFVYDFKASQASLAKIRDNKFSERFELYINGIEIANGFEELTNSQEQLSRFELDSKQRQNKSLHVPPIDTNFLKSIESMPECSGVALGIDRLVMLILNELDIEKVLAFPIESA